MTADDFRRLALALPEAIEASHMGHPDFRVRGKIFATLGAAADRGMVKLTPEQQEVVVSAEPAVFAPSRAAGGAAAPRT
ncbi:MAG: MmcQ/YjbR family DNA-binding protein [Caulobacteraceae bacterium]